FRLPRQADSKRAARIERKEFAVPVDEHGEFAVDLAADVILGRRHLGLDVVAIQRHHPRAALTPILLHARQEARIGQGRRRADAITAQLDIQSGAIEYRHGIHDPASATFPSLATPATPPGADAPGSPVMLVTAGAFSSIFEKWTIKQYS